MNNRGLDYLKEAALDRELPPGTFNTIFLIWHECWDGDNNVHWSNASTIPQLAKEWGLHRGTMWRQIEKLFDFGWIEVMRIKKDIIRLRPSLDAITMQDGRADATRRAGAPGGGGINLNNIESIVIEEPSLTGAQTRRGRADATEDINFVDPPKDFNERLEMLTDAGVYTVTAFGIVDQEHATKEYIQSWLEYIKCDKARGIGFAVRRMSDGDIAPAYCLICGGVGGNHSWVNTEKEGFTECPVEYYSGIPDAEMKEQFGEITWERRER